MQEKHLSYYNRQVVLVAMFEDDDDAIRDYLQGEEEADEAVEAMLLELASSSDEEVTTAGGSRTGKAPNKKRDFGAAYSKLTANYFSGTDSVYNEQDFERRFRMSRNIFDRIWNEVHGCDPFIHKRDCLGKWGIHPLCRLTACLRYIDYGDAFDREDENLSLSETSLSDSVKAFTKIMKAKFGKQYLNRCPTKEEREQISISNAAKGFPGLFASWDCKHYTWKNCPMRWAGQHKGHAEGGRKTLIMEAISDADRYLWYCNFGDAGSLNDLNVLDKSSIIAALLAGKLDLKIEPYTINGKERDWCYFLVDGIYPEWSIFVKTFSDKYDAKKKLFASRQEAVRKDIECAFGILVQKYQILARPLRNWYLDEMKDLVDCCVILHNMSVEERRGRSSDNADDEPVDPNSVTFPLFGKQEITPEQAMAEGVDLFAARVGRFSVAMESPWEHYELKKDLVEHIHSKFG